MGSVRKDARGTGWQARYRDRSGRQRTRTFPSKAEARAYLGTVETDLAQGHLDRPLPGQGPLLRLHRPVASVARPSSPGHPEQCRLESRMPHPPGVRDLADRADRTGRRPGLRRRPGRKGPGAVNRGGHLPGALPDLRHGGDRRRHPPDAVPGHPPAPPDQPHRAVLPHPGGGPPPGRVHRRPLPGAHLHRRLHRHAVGRAGRAPDSSARPAPGHDRRHRGADRGERHGANRADQDGQVPYGVDSPVPGRDSWPSTWPRFPSEDGYVFTRCSTGDRSDAASTLATTSRRWTGPDCRQHSGSTTSATPARRC